MKKLMTLIAVLFMSLFCLTGCNEIHRGNLETIEVTSYVKEEETSKLTGGMLFYCIFGSYKKTDTSKTIQRYIFLAQNGPRDSYKINDVRVYSDPNDEPVNYVASYVYFIYTEENETPYLEYQKEEGMETKQNYWLHLPKASVLEIANNMFRDL